MAINIPFLNRAFWGATTGDYIWCGALIVLTLLLKKPFARSFTFVVSRIAVRFSHGKYRRLFMGLVRKPVEWLFASVLLFIAINFISLPLSRLTVLRFHRKDGVFRLDAGEIIEHLFFFFSILFTAQMLSRIVDFIYRSQMEHAHHTAQKERTQILPLVKEIVKALYGSLLSSGSSGLFSRSIFRR